MVEGTSHMFITGPDVIKTVTGEDMTFEDHRGDREKPWEVRRRRPFAVLSWCECHGHRSHGLDAWVSRRATRH